MKNTELAFAVYRHYRSVYPELKHYYGIVANYGLVQLAEIAGPLIGQQNTHDLRR